MIQLFKKFPRTVHSLVLARKKVEEVKKTNVEAEVAEMVEELVWLTLGSSLGYSLSCERTDIPHVSKAVLAVLCPHSQECLIISSCPVLSFLGTRITKGGMREHGVDIRYCPCHHCVLMSPISLFLH